MILLNTFIVPLFTPKGPKIFENFIHASHYICLVVLGQGERTEFLIELADFHAQFTFFNVTRKVVWLPDHETFRPQCLKLLKTDPNFKEEDYEKVRMFALSPVMDIAKFTILDEELKDKTISSILIKKAFWVAGLKELES